MPLQLQVIFSSSSVSSQSFKALAQMVRYLADKISFWFLTGHNSRSTNLPDKKKIWDIYFFHEESIYEISKGSLDMACIKKRDGQTNGQPNLKSKMPLQLRRGIKFYFDPRPMRGIWMVLCTVVKSMINTHTHKKQKKNFNFNCHRSTLIGCVDGIVESTSQGVVRE